MRFGRRARRVLPWMAALCLAAGAAWMAAWMAQRTLRTGARKRAAQSWLDERLNSDVSLGGDPLVRIHLLRDSRLGFGPVEVENPNALFPGKFIVAGRLEISAPPWAMAGLWPGRLQLTLRDFRIAAEENEAGEWSLDGLMRPLLSGTGKTAFPYPIPSLSEWRAELAGGTLAVRRNGRELKLTMEGEASGRMDGGRIVLHLAKNELSTGLADGSAVRKGGFGPVSARLAAAQTRDAREPLRLEEFQGGIEELPLSFLPFLFAGLPLADVSGVFSGVASWLPLSGALAEVRVEGELRDAPLVAFGLPKQSPFTLNWPIPPLEPGQKARIRLGPPGFGSFEMEMPLDADGRPELLAVRSDVAVLDDLSPLFADLAEWPDWLARVFPSVEWTSRNWMGFGWSGKALRLSLTRATAGLRLSGEAEMANGRIRLETTPDRPELPVSAAAESVDAAAVSETLNAMLPDSFRAKISAGDANVTCRALLSERGGFLAWGAGLVFSAPEIRMAESGSWWGGTLSVAGAVAKAVSDWGGGDGDGLLALTTIPVLRLKQISIACDRGREGELGLEFRAHGDYFGQIAGYVARGEDGGHEGELILFGESAILLEAAKANQELGLILMLMANEMEGLRVVFRISSDGEPRFSFPFLAEAAALRDQLRRRGGAVP